MERMSPYYNAVGLRYLSGDYSLEPTFPTEIRDYSHTLYTIKEGDTLQNISFKFYGDSGYWHYLCEMNEIVNPFKEVIPGVIIKIPKLDG